MESVLHGPAPGDAATLRERGSFELLSATMDIYLRHPRQFMILSGVAMVPAAAFSLLVGLTALWAYALAAALLAVSLSVVAGAGVVMVGQHYLRRRIDVHEAYQRVLPRIAAVLAVSVGLGIVMTLAFPTIIIVVPFAAVLAYAVTWSFGSSVVVAEKSRMVAALKKSRKLVAGSWWRVFGFLLALWLVATGVGLLIALVPGIISETVFGDSSSSAVFIGWAGVALAVVVVPPIIAIGYALMYLDLRNRREDFSLQILESELALAPVGVANGTTQAGPHRPAHETEAEHEEGGNGHQIDVEGELIPGDGSGSAN